MTDESAQYDGSLRKEEELLVGRVISTPGNGGNSIEFATANQMAQLKKIYGHHVADDLGPIKTVTLPIAHNPEHVGAHVVVVPYSSRLGEAVLPGKMMGRASLNQIPYDSQLSTKMIQTQLGAAITQRLNELEFNAVRRDNAGSPSFDPKSGRMKQDWPTRFPPGSEYRIGTVPVRAKYEDNTDYTRPGFMLYLNTALPPHVDAAVREAGRDSETVGALMESHVVRDARDYADRNHQRVLHEIGQVIRDAVDADHAVFITTDDKKADKGKYDVYPKLASPTGPTMSLNEIKGVEKIGAVLYHSAATDVRGAGNVLVGDYHQPILLVPYESSTSRHSRSGVDNSPRKNGHANAFPSTIRPLTKAESARAASAILGNRAMLERVQNTFSPMYTPSEHQTAIHAHVNEIRRPHYAITHDTVALHTRFHPLSDAHEQMLANSKFGARTGMGKGVVSIEPVYSVANLGVAP